jgi:hypothetical protein
MVRSTKRDYERLYPLFPEDLWSVVENADRMTLYSLRSWDEEDWKGQSFRGYPLLGQTDVEGETLANVIEALHRGLYEKSDPKRCFMPHHGIRVQLGKKTIDMLICFLCDVMIHYSSLRSKKGVWGQISRAPKRILNRLLKKAGITQVPEWMLK